MIAFVRWWFIVCALVTGAAFLESRHAFEYMWNIDKTKVTVITLSLFLIVTSFIGFLTYKIRVANQTRYIDYLPACNFAAQAVQGLGLIGTILGFMMMFQGNVSHVDAGNTEQLKSLMFTMGTGFTTAVVTTLVGVASSLLLQLQLVNLGLVSDEE